MTRRPPRSTLTDTRCPDTTLFRSAAARAGRRPTQSPLCATHTKRSRTKRFSQMALSGHTLPKMSIYLRGRHSEHLYVRCCPFRRHVSDRPNPLRKRRSEEHTSELQSLMRTSYAAFCLKKKQKHTSILHTLILITHTFH